MLFSQQPALRHFAVLSLEKRIRCGTVWLVKDRRGLGESQFLLVPSRSRAWPVLLSSLSDHQASPVRLRNGKVAILLGSKDLQSVQVSLRRTKKLTLQKLNAISGFEEVEKKNPRRPMIAIVSIAVITLLVLFIPKPVEANTEVVVEKKVETPVESCSKPIPLEAQLLGTIAVTKQIELDGLDYKIASKQRLGGLIQLKLKRNCDKKYFSVDAWSSNDQVIVSKVY